MLQKILFLKNRFLIWKLAFLRIFADLHRTYKTTWRRPTGARHTETQTHFTDTHIYAHPHLGTHSLHSSPLVGLSSEKVRMWVGRWRGWGARASWVSFVESSAFSGSLQTVPGKFGFCKTVRLCAARLPVSLTWLAWILEEIIYWLSAYLFRPTEPLIKQAGFSLSLTEHVPVCRLAKFQTDSVSLLKANFSRKT